MFRMTSRVKDLTSIFVYGTLKRNEPNHHLMIEKNAEFVSEGTTVEIRPFIVATERNVPYLLNTNKVGKVIKIDDQNSYVFIKLIIFII